MDCTATPPSGNSRQFRNAPRSSRDSVSAAGDGRAVGGTASLQTWSILTEDDVREAEKSPRAAGSARGPVAPSPNGLRRSENSGPVPRDSAEAREPTGRKSKAEDDPSDESGDEDDDADSSPARRSAQRKASAGRPASRRTFWDGTCEPELGELRENQARLHRFVEGGWRGEQWGTRAFGLCSLLFSVTFGSGSCMVELFI